MVAGRVEVVYCVSPILMVKACRQITYQNLTITMIQSIKENDIIDHTVFKTKEKYVFDSLILIKCYIYSIICHG